MKVVKCNYYSYLEYSELNDDYRYSLVVERFVDQNINKYRHGNRYHR